MLLKRLLENKTEIEAMGACLVVSLCTANEAIGVSFVEFYFLNSLLKLLPFSAQSIISFKIFSEH